MENKNVLLGPSEKKDYVAPTVTRWGTVTDLTKTGNSFRGGDAKNGTVQHSRGI